MTEKLRQPPEGMGMLAVMGKEGDTRTVWNPENEVEVDAARMQFDHLRAKGYLAYKVGLRGKKGDKVEEFDGAAGKMILAFDPSPGKTIMTPPMAGGAEAATVEKRDPVPDPPDVDQLPDRLYEVERQIRELRSGAPAPEDAWGSWNAGTDPVASDPVFGGALSAATAAVDTARSYYLKHLAE